MRYSLLLLLITMASYCQSPSKLVGGGCDGCELIFDGMPKVMNHIDTSSAWQDSKSRLMVYGIIYKSDGKTPAPGTILYYYHTDKNGKYTPGKNQTMARRHGALRGWVKANSRGEYKIYTIRPAEYPNEKIPAHIHMIIKEPNLNEYYIDDIQFDDDPLLTTAERKHNTNRTGSGVIITGEKNDLTTAERNITLGLNIQNYPVVNNTQVASGLSVGENCPAFDPIHFSGADKGTKRCPMCSYGTGQGIMIWWNTNNTEALAALLKKLDPLIEKHGVKKLRVFAIYMNPEKKSQKAMTKDMTLLAEKAILKNVALLYTPMPDDDEIFKSYRINPKVENTIMIYRKRKVVDKYVNYNSNDSQTLLTRLEL